MATFPQMATSELCANHLQGSASFACLFSPQFSQRNHDLLAAGRQRRHRYTTRTAVTCSNDGGGNTSDDGLLRHYLERPDRREVVLGGLGGLAGLGLNHAAAFASPIAPPDLSKCHAATATATDTRDLECCPPFSMGEKAIDFTFPSFSKPKVRPAAHKVDAAYIQKFEFAIKKMKDLPGDDPRNFYQQANVHCAYCNDAYDQVGVPIAEKDPVYIQVHANWLFFPFHRIYLYFWERILGSLIGDENFAIPFWNWDHPDGMVMPSFYTNTRSPLYTPNRDSRHLPNTTAILDWSEQSATYDDRQRQIDENLNTMYRSMISGGKTAELFMGASYVTGQREESNADRSNGSMERTPHNNLHVWCGNAKNKFGEDMGNFYSAGRDCLFYGLHANVDRMWDVWTRDLKNDNFADPDWLNAAFYFYDENQRLVRVKVSDTLSSEKLGFTYERRPLPWLTTAPTRQRFEPIEKTKELAAKTLAQFPLTLSSTVSTIVKRPKPPGGNKGLEVLIVSGIELGKTVAAKFDVFVNAPDAESLTASAAELAGSFTNVIIKKREGADVIPIRTNLKLCLSDVLTQIGAEDNGTIVVTLVPRQGAGKVKIQGVRIAYI